MITLAIIRGCIITTIYHHVRTTKINKMSAKCQLDVYFFTISNNIIPIIIPIGHIVGTLCPDLEILIKK